MKTVRNNKSIFFSAVVVSLTLFIISSVLYGQVNPIEQLNNKKLAIANLLTGLNSDNLGLKRSSIYLAGKYKIKEVVPELLIQIDEEDDPTIRTLIAMVLFEIGEKEGIEVVRELAQKDNDPLVRNMCSAIVIASAGTEK